MKKLAQEKRRGPGQPAHAPNEQTRRQVESMASYGVPQLEIGKALRLSDKTLRKHYAFELETAATKATSLVAQSLFRKATSDSPQSVVAAIFWLKTRAGWKEPPTEGTLEATVRVEGGLPDKEPE